MASEKEMLEGGWLKWPRGKKATLATVTKLKFHTTKDKRGYYTIKWYKNK